MGALTGKNLSKSISKSYKNLSLYLVILYDFGSDFIGFLRLGAPYNLYQVHLLYVAHQLVSLVPL